MTPIIVLGALAAFYFLPTILAFRCSHRQAVAIFALNLLLGWTLVGWVIALVWALASPAPAQTIIVQQTGASVSTTPPTGAAQ